MKKRLRVHIPNIEKSLLLSQLVKMGILKRTFDNFQTVVRLTEKGYQFLREFFDLLEKTMSGEIFKENPIKLPAEVLLNFLHEFYSPSKSLFGKREKIILDIVYFHPGLSVEDICQISGIHKRTVAKYLYILCKNGLIVKEGRKHYPRKEYHDLYIKILQNPGIKKDTLNEKDRKIIEVLKLFGCVVDVNGALYVRKGIIVKEKIGEKERKSYYRLTDKAYQEGIKHKAIKKFIESRELYKKVYYPNEDAKKALNLLLEKKYIEPIYITK